MKSKAHSASDGLQSIDWTRDKAKARELRKKRGRGGRDEETKS